MFLSVDLLSEYRIQHGAIGPLYVTSSYSTWIFCRGVSGFATDCPCVVCCRGLTTCLLHVGPPFGNRFLNTIWAIDLTYWIVYLHLFLYFDICNYICLDTSYRFWLYLYFLNILYFFKYSCINIFHTFYGEHWQSISIAIITPLAISAALTHWGQDKIDTILPDDIFKCISWMKMYSD